MTNQVSNAVMREVVMDIQNSKNQKPPLPGEVIKEKMEKLGWIQEDLVFILGWSRSVISTLITGKIKVTVKRAWALSDCFNTGPTYWMELQMNHDLWQLGYFTSCEARRQG